MRTGHEVYLPARDRHSRERLALVGELHGGDRGRAARAPLPAQGRPPRRRSARGRGARALEPPRARPAHAGALPAARRAERPHPGAHGVRRWTARWRRSGAPRPLAVAVNLGPADLLDLDLPAEVAGTLERRRFPPERLTLEVSEDLIVADPERTLYVLDRLRPSACRSPSTTSARDSPRCRISASCSSTSSRSTARSYSSMSRSARDSAIVALDDRPRAPARAARGRRGRRDEEDWSRRSPELDAAQGELLSRPVPIGELGRWVAQRSWSRVGRLEQRHRLSDLSRGPKLGQVLSIASRSPSRCSCPPEPTLPCWSGALWVASTDARRRGPLDPGRDAESGCSTHIQ